MSPDPTLAQLRAFLRIVERGSLSGAAHDLGTTQPTISRQLKHLESIYGGPLLVRTTRALRLTPAGQRVYDFAQAFARSEETLRESLSCHRTQVAGHLRVAAPSGFGSFVVVPFCSRFIQLHPGVTIDLRLSDAPVDLIREGIDVAVRIGQLSDLSLYARRVATLEEVLVAHPSCVRRPIAQPSDTASLPWTGFSGLQDSSDIRFVRNGEIQTVKVIPHLKIDQIVGHREALLAGVGLGLIHRYAVEDDIAAGRLMRLLPDWSLPAWPLHTVFPAKLLSKRLHAWCEQFKLDLADLAGVATSQA